jgi:hypothetical protein
MRDLVVRICFEERFFDQADEAVVFHTGDLGQT